MAENKVSGLNSDLRLFRRSNTAGPPEGAAFLSGGGGGNGGFSAELKNPDRIKVYTGISGLATEDNTFSAAGFSVTVGGAAQTIKEIYTHSTYGDAFDINLESDVPGTGDIRVSYDGTGNLFGGKLKAFTNLAVSRK